MKESKLKGLVCTAIVHVVVLLLLFFVVFEIPQAQEEEGVPIMMGDMPLAAGESDSYTYTEVEVEPVESPTVPAEPEQIVPVDVREEIITQSEEESVKMPEQQKEEIKPRPEETKPVVKPVKKEKTEAEKRAEAEARKKAEAERAEAERKAREKAAAERAAANVAGAFGKGKKMGSRGEAEGKGAQGSATGNSATGKRSGSAGYGSADLGGRSLVGKLPRPVYNVQEEGRVVVTITVNPSGRVVRAQINKRTNTASSVLQREALRAAQKAIFNNVDGVDNQTGTITYYFKLN